MAIIGIDATALSTSACGGIGVSQYQTMRALSEIDTPHRFVLYAATPPVVPFSRRPLDLPWPVRLGSGPLARRNIVWMQTGVNRLLTEDHVDVFWGPRHLLPLRAHGAAKVATINDFWERYYPDQQPWLNRQANRILIRRVVEHADVVAVPSRATARDAERFLVPTPGKVRVVPLGVDPEVFRPLGEARVRTALRRLHVTEPYLLSLDVYNPRKGFSVVLRAVSQLPRGLRENLSVVALGRSRNTAVEAKWLVEARNAGLGARLRLPGDVEPGDLVALYSGALALAYPSLYEGFGMPVLEAMACGCPVITADCSSLPEVAGGAALLVDPTRPGQLAEAIEVLATDSKGRARLVTAGRVRAAECTWRKTAVAMLAAFDDALRLRTGHAR